MPCDEGNFSLTASWYWSGTEFGLDPSKAWDFSTGGGWTGASDKYLGRSGLALRGGAVSPAGGPAAVPEPATMLLFGTGLTALIGAGKYKNSKRV